MDILISAHGAQLAGMAFMPDCGNILELSPKGYHIPYFFGSLANASGLGHGYIYMSSGDPAEETKQMSTTVNKRIKARNANLCPSTKEIIHGLLDLIDDWKNCCKSKVTVAKTPSLSNKTNITSENTPVRSDMAMNDSTHSLYLGAPQPIQGLGHR